MRVTLLSGPERRRRWSSAEKLRIVEESLLPGTTVAEVARRNDVHPNLLHAWRREAHTGTLSMAGDDTGHFAPVAIASESSVAGTMARSDAGAEPAIEVVLRNGRMLRVPEGAAPRRVAALADALEGVGR